jgi:hypothetical protein
MRLITLSLAAISLLSSALAGCGPKPQPALPLVLITKTAPIEFTFPAGWQVNADENPYDLQCLAPLERMNTGVFAFRKIDLAAEATPAAILQEQIDDLASKRKNFQEVEARRTQELADKTITSVTYAGEKDLARNYYSFSLIEFKADQSKFAIAIQVAVPGEWAESKPVLEAIVRSARPLP